jgi:hypothetical protein
MKKPDRGTRPSYIDDIPFEIALVAALMLIGIIVGRVMDRPHVAQTGSPCAVTASTSANLTGDLITGSVPAAHQTCR